MQTKDPFELASECIAFAVRRASRVVTSHYDHHLSEHGLRSTQFTILNALAALEDVTVNELAEQLQSDRTTLTRNLDRLESYGWIERRAGEDRRSRRITLTLQGRRQLKAALPAWMNAQGVLVRRMGRGPFQRLLTELTELEEMCE